MSEPIAFFCRARPQGADAWPIFDTARCVFIGYPIARAGAEYNPQSLSSCLINPNYEEWEEVSPLVNEWRREYSTNRNLIRKVRTGSIVLVPRPSLGVVFISRITGEFEIFDNPPWRSDYLKLRREQGLDDDDDGCWHTADVGQGWRVEPYRRVALSRIPGWIRTSLFGRSTYGVLRPHPLTAASAHSVLEPLLDRRTANVDDWTLDIGEVKLRLLDQLTASSFEHLVVSLLQLDHPHERWTHTGGAGDGGVDGLGTSDAGETVGLLQCKFWSDTAPDFDLDGNDAKPPRIYSAVLLPEQPAPPSHATLLDLAWISERVVRHWRDLPQARAMRIGEPQGS